MDWSIAAALLSPFITIVSGFFIFERQQKWNKKLALYEEIIESINKIKKESTILKNDVIKALGVDIKYINTHGLNKIAKEIETFRNRKPIYKMFIGKNEMNKIDSIFSRINLILTKAERTYELENNRSKKEEFLGSFDEKTSELDQFVLSGSNVITATIDRDLNSLKKIRTKIKVLKLQALTKLGKKYHRLN